MQEIVSPLQSISYTNKDFQRIYPELLDLVKQLTNKWDPSISNESDPGVILIKLNALIADKCNYNLDKNVLECFPLSVTQTKNARQLFEQLGYKMKWYKSATAYLSLKWIGTLVDGVTYTIPAFTMVTDTEKSVVYTIVGSIPATSSQEFYVSPITLLADGTTTNAKVIQGVAVRYDINGDTIITPQHLDENNRIYFNVSNIAENGIFITNTGMSNYSSWIQKDNLLVEDYGNTFYKFGVTADGSVCYIEFPEDAETIIKDGIEITYIRTNGSYGNIKPQQLTNFYSDISVVSSLNDPVVLSTSNVQLINYFASNSGKDPETINEAYKNYQRIIGTYKTLITLRDYLNYILSNDLASNGFTCDRSNDIQCTYDVMEYNNGLNIRNTIIENDGGDPSLTAFSLKLYLLKYFSDISTVASFNSSFVLQNDSELLNVKDYIADLKALQHDYAPILKTSDTRSNICLFKNKYPLKCTIIPQYKLSSTQETELKANINTALYRNLNSKEINFGEKISADYLYKIIQNADARIKNVILDTIDYTTYAVYLNSDGKYYEIPVSGNFDNNCIIQYVNANDQQITSATISIDSDTFVNKMITTNNYSYSLYSFTYDGSNWQLNGSNVSLSNYGISLSNDTPVSGNKILVQVSKQTQIKDEIFAKSILAGITPFFVQDEEIDFKLDQSKSANYNFKYSNIKSVSSQVLINVNNSKNYYKMRDNESVQLFAPNLLQKATYNNYVKFEVSLQGGKIIEGNTFYELQENEYIVFYWKSSSNSGLYQYTIYSSGCIIKPTFNLSSSVNITQTSIDLYNEITSLGKNFMSGTVDVYSSSVISALTASQNILSSDKEIGYYIINSLELDDNYNCYWVLNEQTIDDEEKYYTLFENGETERILEAGEYFFYTTNEMQSFVSLGSGTRVTRNSSAGVWRVNAIDLSDITVNGISILSGEWFKLTSGQIINIEEDQFISISQNYTLKVQPKSTSSTWSLTIDDTAVSLEDYNVYYTTYSWNSSIDEVPESEWVQLPYYDFTNFSPWYAKSALSISCSKDTEQILLDNQKLILNQVDNDVPIEIQGSDRVSQSNESYYPVVIRTNDILAITGLNEHDTISYDTNLQPVYLDVYVYSKQLSRNSVVTYLGQNMQVIILAGQSSSNTSYPPVFTLSAGNYLIPIIVPNLENNSFIEVEYKINGSSPTLLNPIYDSTITKLAGGKLYPLSLVVPNDNQQYSLVIKLVNSSGTAISAPTNIPITINNPYKYIPSQSLSKILYLINMFDSNHNFNYIYVAPSGQTVEDPLDSASFLNLNHIYHDYTICQLDTSSLNNVKVTY